MTKLFAFKYSVQLRAFKQFGKGILRMFVGE